MLITKEEFFGCSQSRLGEMGGITLERIPSSLEQWEAGFVELTPDSEKEYLQWLERRGQKANQTAPQGQGGDVNLDSPYSVSMKVKRQGEPELSPLPIATPSKDILFRQPIKLTKNEKRKKLALEAKQKLGYSLLYDEKFAAEALDEVLFMLDIAPLNTEAVLEYQKKMVEAKGGQATVNKAGYKWEAFNVAGTDIEIPATILEKCLLIKDALPEAQFFVEICQYDPDPFVGVCLITQERRPYTTASRRDISQKYVKRYLWVFDEPGFDVLESQIRTLE